MKVSPQRRELPRVDVLLPLLNAAEFLAETLAGLERQKDCDFRVLAWDNGSTDGTVELLRRWIPDRVPGVIVTDEPLPLGACLARLVEIAETELIARIDGDDVPTPDRLALQAAALRDDPGLAAVCGYASTIDAGGNELRRYEIPADDLSLQWMLLFTNPFLHSNMMLRRKAVLDAGNYRDCLPVEDYDLWMRMAPLGRFGTVTTSTLEHRAHDAGVSAATRSHWKTIIPAMQQQHWPLLLPGLDAGELALLTAASRWIHTEKTKGRPGIPAGRFMRIARRFARTHGVSLREVVASPGFRFTRRNLFRHGITTRAWRLAWSVLATGARRGAADGRRRARPSGRKERTAG